LLQVEKLDMAAV